MSNPINEFDKIRANVLEVFLRHDKWVFKYKNSFYDLAPAQIMEVVLSPLIIGVDKLVMAGCQAKKIDKPENGFNLVFSETYFPNADVKLNYREVKSQGWIYDIESLNLKVMEGQAAWICPYMQMFYKEPPKTFFIKLEEKH